MFYTGVALAFQLVLGMAIALLLDSDRRGYSILRALMILPLVIPPAVTAMMFLLMLNGSFGVISRGLIAIGLLPFNYSILGNASTAMAGVLLAEIWQWTPFMVLIMLAGLRSLPKEPFEAAAIDGASQSSVSSTILPMMSKVIAIAVLICGIDLMRTFDYVKVMTDSGPGTATETPLLCWTNIFRQREFPLRLDDRAIHADRCDHRLVGIHQHFPGEAVMNCCVPADCARPGRLLHHRDLLFLFSGALASFKPIAAMFDKDRVIWSDFEPHLNNYKVTLMGVSRTQSTVDPGITMGAAGADSYDARQSLLDSAIVSIGATGVTIFCAVIAAYALSRMTFSGRGAYLNWVLGMRFMPPIAIIIPWSRSTTSPVCVTPTICIWGISA